MKTSVEDAVDIMYPAIRRRINELVTLPFTPVNGAAMSAAPLEDALAWDIAEAYEDLADFLSQNQAALLDSINSRLHGGYRATLISVLYDRVSITLRWMLPK